MLEHESGVRGEGRKTSTGARQSWYSVLMDFVIVGAIRDIQTIAVGRAIREVARLRSAYGAGRWRKLKGTATVQFADGTVAVAEVHWYEVHGMGRKEIKIKRLLDDEA